MLKLSDLDLGIGKRTRLHRLFYEYGMKNGTLILLPIDQGLEHGPRDFFANPESLNPEYQLRIALEGGYSGIVFHIGLAEKYMEKYAGKVPLILKLNGKTEIPPDDEAFSPQTATVEDAVRLSADAVGYTLYVGSPKQAEDFIQVRKIREDCEKYGMPLIIWSYPRGKPVEAKGGRDSLYAVDYAARVAQELGADLVKLNFPNPADEKSKASPKPYNELTLSPLESVKKVVASAGKTMVIISGGAKMSDDELLEKARLSMEGGCVGLIFGRNIWQRKHDEAIAMTKRIKEIMAKFGR